MRNADLLKGIRLFDVFACFHSMVDEIGESDHLLHYLAFIALFSGGRFGKKEHEACYDEFLRRNSNLSSYPKLSLKVTEGTILNTRAGLLCANNRAYELAVKRNPTPWSWETRSTHCSSSSGRCSIRQY